MPRPQRPSPIVIKEQNNATSNMPVATDEDFNSRELSFDGVKYQLENIQTELVQDTHPLGRGRYGEVFKVYCKPAEKWMACKMLQLEGGDCMNRNLNELKMLKRIKNNYCINFYGHIFEENCLSIYMELLSISLDNAIKSCASCKVRIPESILGQISFSVVSALQYLKQINVMHRDVKPSNVLMGLDPHQNMRVKICDFGISGELVNSFVKTNIGSQIYQAPEMISGCSQFTAKADVWSFGMTLIELATLQHPFGISSSRGISFQVVLAVKQDPPRLPPNDPSYSNELRELTSACMRKDPNHRANYDELLQLQFLRNASVEEDSMRRPGGGLHAWGSAIILKWSNPQTPDSDIALLFHMNPSNSQSAVLVNRGDPPGGTFAT